jgi:hypothetical protein
VLLIRDSIVENAEGRKCRASLRTEGSDGLAREPVETRGRDKVRLLAKEF